MKLEGQVEALSIGKNGAVATIRIDGLDARYEAGNYAMLYLPANFEDRNLALGEHLTFKLTIEPEQP